MVAPLNRLGQAFLERGHLVVKTRDWHLPVTKHFAVYGGIWPVHCVQDTTGAEFHPDLLDDPRIHLVSKGLGDEDCYSGFDGTDLADWLRTYNVEEIWVGGLATDYCVKNTVLDGLKEGFRVRLLTEASRAVEINEGDSLRAIEEMEAAGARLY